MTNNYHLNQRKPIFLLKTLLSVILLLFASENIKAQVNVTATVGTLSASYATLKLAFDEVNAGTHKGIIAISLTGNTTETVSAILKKSSAPASYTTVGITATVPVTISGNIVGAVIKLNGADNVTIDGRIAGTGRNITVQNTSTTTDTAAIWLASVTTGNGCTNNMVRNLELACGAPQNTNKNNTFGIIMCGTTIAVTANGVDNDNNMFTENRIIRSRYGIVTAGTTTNLNQNITVTNNIIGPTAFGVDQIGKVGIFMQADNLAVVSGNLVQYVGGLLANTPSGSADRIGIAVGVESYTNTPLTLISTNYTIKKNIIHDIIDERAYSAVGLLLATTNSGAPTNNLVSNNIIYNVRTNGTAGDQTVGMAICGGHSDIVANNSISLTGDIDPSAGAGTPTMIGSGIRISNGNGTDHTNLTLTNNSVYMDLSSSNAPSIRFYAISGLSTAYFFGTGGENYNNYYINVANPQVQTGGLGTTGSGSLASQFATLTDWKTAYTVPQDTNSVQGNPNYVSAIDFHVSGASVNIDAGTSIASVTDDIDGDSRPVGVSYDIGADEFVPLSANEFNLADGFKAYPNPVNNILNIEFYREFNEVKVFNMLGKEVLIKKVNANTTQIDMSVLDTGTYFVKISSENTFKTIKVFKN